MPFTDYPSAKEYLFSLKHHGAKYGIDRMLLLAASLGNPERTFPVIHVAGTNGKGSVCAMIEAILRGAGYKTGLYTSPHLVRQAERIQVDRTLITDNAIVAYTNELQSHANQLACVDPDDHPSFFEFMTGMAFLHFARSGVDVGVTETGLGGRLDATNVVDPEVSVITSIARDHTEQLGDTLERIAAEKAGIIKRGKPVVIGHLPPEAETVIRKACEQRNAPLKSIRERFGNESAYPTTNLPGRYQRWNAALATLAVETLADRFPNAVNAAPRVLQQVAWAGRWETRKVDGRHLILDTSHNEEGALMLDANLRDLRNRIGQKPDIVVGILGLARAQKLLPVVARHAASIHLIRPRQGRACPFTELESCIPEDFKGAIFRSKVSQLFPGQHRCRLGNPGDTIVATGSIYMIGEIVEAISCPEPVAEHVLQ